MTDLTGGDPTRPEVTTYATVSTSIFLIGWAAGGLVFGMFGDRIGRVRTLTLTVRYVGFETHTRSKTLAEPLRLDSDIFAVFQGLFRLNRDAKRKVRLLGVSLSGLAHGGEQLGLLDAERRKKQEKLTSAADRLRDRFGFGKLQFGASLHRDQSGDDREDS